MKRFSLFKRSKHWIREDEGFELSYCREKYHITKELMNLSFLHVGKCGGTSLMQTFVQNGIKLNEYHLNWNRNKISENHFTWVRNPISRFVSAFNHSKTVLNFELDGLDPEALTLKNCPSPGRVYNSFSRGYTFNPEYDELINSFNTANELAESMSSNNSELKERALTLMNSSNQHIFKGLGWYFKNGEMISEKPTKLLMVGKMERMNADFKKLSNLLDIPELKGVHEINQIREGNVKLEKSMSKLAVNNIRNFYKASDYKTLAIFQRFGYIAQETLDEYHTYKFQS